MAEQQGDSRRQDSVREDSQDIMVNPFVLLGDVLIILLLICSKSETKFAFFLAQVLGLYHSKYLMVAVSLYHDNLYLGITVNIVSQ